MPKTASNWRGRSFCLQSCSSWSRQIPNPQRCRLKDSDVAMQQQTSQKVKFCMQKTKQKFKKEFCFSIVFVYLFILFSIVSYYLQFNLETFNQWFIHNWTVNWFFWHTNSQFPSILNAQTVHCVSALYCRSHIVYMHI